MATLDKIRLSGTTYDIIDATAIHSLDGYYTTGETNAAITAATNALAESIAEQGYQTSGDVQNAISGKVDTNTYTAYTASTDTALGNKADTTAVTQSINEATSGKLDTSIFQTYSGDTNTALASKFAGATWNSTDKKIYFYDNASATGTALAYIDATDFVKDGFLSSVTIDNRTISGESVPCLVFIWNTDAGIQETDIPISGIFNPTNYVSIDTFTAYTASTNTVIGGKADTTAVTQSITEAISGKQDTMSAGTSINITDNVISLVADNALSKSSTNPVVNSAITDAVIVEGTQGSVDGHLWKNQTITKDFTYDENVYMFRTYKGGTYECYIENFQLILTNSSGGTQTYTNPEQTFSDDKVDFVVDSKYYFSATTKDDWYITKITFKETENQNGINWEYKWNRNGYPEMDAATAIHDYIYPELSGKQDALVSGTNIKTVNGNSLLGSGDITVQTLPTVSGTTLIF